MSTRIRLQRHGRKGRPIFTIVAADIRSKRDGKYIEKLGIYNPNTNPATIDLDFDKALTWVRSGAQPSDTVRAILSYKGVMMKKHLLEGVDKGALTADQAEEKFNAWLSAKENKIQGKKDGLTSDKTAAQQARLDAEAAVAAKKAADIAAKNAPAVEEAPEAPAEEEVAAEGEAPAAEETSAE